jgi:predicted kinase
MALRLIRPAAPSIVAIGGVSGTGKSSLAFGLAPELGPVPGAVVLRSDEIRKRLSGAKELEPLGPDAYSPTVSRRVYDLLAERAAAVAQAGHAVIVDAVFLRPEDRQSIEEAAARVSVPFAGIWLEAPEGILVQRVEQRRADASDADAAIVRRQLEEGPGVVSWMRISASGGREEVLQKAQAAAGAADVEW